MEFGIFGVGDRSRDPTTGHTPTEFERIHAIVRIAKHAEEVGFDVFAIGEHHNPPFISSADTTLLAYIGAQTEKIQLSTSTTLITTNDPVRIAEEFATLQHLTAGRVDLMLGRGNTAEVYPWFGQHLRNGIPLALENYALLHRLWREENLDWKGEFRTPLQGFTSVPRPLNGKPPFVWHGSIRSPEIAEQAAKYGDGFFVNNLFMSVKYFQQFVDHYRRRYEEHGHGKAENAIVGAGGSVFIRGNRSDAIRDFQPFYDGMDRYYRGIPMQDAMQHTGMMVGGPEDVIERVLSFQEAFGPYQRQLFGMDFGGVPEKDVLKQLDLMGEKVLPVLRQELRTQVPFGPVLQSH